MNKEFRDEHTSAQESSWRKKYANAYSFYKNVFQSLSTSEDMDFLEKERILQEKTLKMRDERNELNRIKRDFFRQKSFIELVKREMEKPIVPFELYPNYSYKFDDTGNDLIVHLTDIHAGIKIDNTFNKYNIEILKDRLTKYLEKIYKISKTHNPTNCYLVLGGDLISGAIHTSLRIENNENVITQIKYVSELLSEFALKLSKIFNNVYIHSVSGNHSRLTPNKENHLKGEELDAFIPFYMKAKLQNLTNIYIIDNTIDESIASFSLRGKLYYAVHGDKDTPKNVASRLSFLTKVIPYCIIMGHRHTNNMHTVDDVKIVESGCVSGIDNYCLDHRLIGTPEQTVLVCTDEGIDCYYDIKLQ